MGVKIFSVAKRKGGVGASSVTVMLATTLAKYRNKKVLIIDTDDQATIADLSLIDEGQGISPLVQVMQMNPARVHLFLQSRKNDYDIIFIDLPRMSNLDSDDKLVMLMYLCDGLLIPILPSKLAVLSTVKFVGIAKDVVKHRLDYGNETILHGFLSLANNRTD
ncbi:MAG: ParA family protein, partial [Bacteroidota bacterium]